MIDFIETRRELLFKNKFHNHCKVMKSWNFFIVVANIWFVVKRYGQFIVLSEIGNEKWKFFISFKALSWESHLFLFIYFSICLFRLSEYYDLFVYLFTCLVINELFVYLLIYSIYFFIHSFICATIAVSYEY